MKKRVIALLFALLLLLSCSGIAFAEGSSPRLIDYAGAIIDSYEEAVLARLDQTSSAIGMDVTAVIVQNLKGRDIEAAADRYIETLGYGTGPERSAFLLLIALDEGQWEVTTSGSAMDYLTYKALDSIEAAILPHLQSGNFGQAVKAYCETVEALVTEANQPVSKLSTLIPKLLGSLGLGLGAGLIGTGVSKGKLKSVSHQTEARSYLRPGSFQLTRSHEIYLYSTISRTPRPKNTSSSSGGPPVHHSSSGTAHRSGGGRF